MNKAELHRHIVKEIKRIESELYALKKQLDPYASEGDAYLFDKLENARSALEDVK